MIKLDADRHWRRARMSQSGPQDAPFRKSSFSAPDGGCVEVGAADERLLVRDTKNRDGAVLSFTSQQWNAFVDGVRAGGLGR
jgi:Domain of unknown function (DUF397)